MSVERVELERFQACVQAEMSKRMVSAFRLRMEDGARFMADMLLEELEVSVYGQRLGVTEIEWPATWWEHFKLRWFPYWLQRRFPVRYHKEQLEARLIYPDIKPLPDRPYFYVWRGGHE